MFFFFFLIFVKLTDDKIRRIFRLWLDFTINHKLNDIWHFKSYFLRIARFFQNIIFKKNLYLTINNYTREINRKLDIFARSPTTVFLGVAVSGTSNPEHAAVCTRTRERADSRDLRTRYNTQYNISASCVVVVSPRADVPVHVTKRNHVSTRAHIVVVV